MTSRNDTARPPSPCPTTCFASRTAASGSTPASATRSRVLPLRITTIARVWIGMLARTKEQGEDQPGPESAHVREKGDPSPDRPNVEKGVESLQCDPVADKDVGGQGENEKWDDEGQDARPREIENVGGEEAGDGAARPQHRDRGVRRDEDLEQAPANPGGEIHDEKLQLPEFVFDVVAKDPEEEHIAPHVQQVGVREKRGNQRPRWRPAVMSAGMTA